jgi:hypothetical protein
MFEMVDMAACDLCARRQDERRRSKDWRAARVGEPYLQVM